MSGTVLLGPGAIVDSADTVRQLKRKLKDCDGDWQLIREGRELLDQERLSDACKADCENELTAVVANTAVVSLRRTQADAQAETLLLQQANEKWLLEFETATEDRKKRQREEDIRVYESAMAALVTQLVADALQLCRRHAGEGHGSVVFVMDTLQHYELAATMFFRRDLKIRADPVLRGWFFKTEGKDTHEPSGVPQCLKLGGTRHQTFIQSIASDLVPKFEEQGLRVLPGSYFGLLQLVWGGVPEDQETDYEKWW
eukprot:CAMPEP_0203949106 /NCGR_PEP_ID=MMETSP0359-20131031/83600_1 /ASSEMBLY_ACC=CAM_ASM_000338 /TAXON_ID=268821 /ORGANISM="Scrippsiella Hangoei, Strain SHTV-5" /LENGTH=255 /DNA_ID=CAMNT_0050880909 /DNA_START=72 /DNA_END=839 /DNA_ORIENTATION=-